MPNIKLLKEPGYIYDLSFLFLWRFNPEVCREEFALYLKSDSEYFLKITKEFGDISDELYVFFHALESERCFFLMHYFSEYQNRFATDYSMGLVQKELSDYPTVIRRMIGFYFPDLQAEKIEKCAMSAGELFEVIKLSDYSDTEKLRLYEFFINPVPYIQKLQFELMQKHVLLSAYYEKNYTKMLSAFNELSFDMLSEQFGSHFDFSFIQEKNETFYLSYCLLRKNCISFFPNQCGLVCCLGTDYATTLRYLSKRTEGVKLEEIGAALSEASRVKILDVILERGEITCKELEKVFEFSGSTAYHHLMVLTKSKVLKTRNEGKTVYYSINERHIDATMDALKKYSSQRRRNT